MVNKCSKNYSFRYDKSTLTSQLIFIYWYFYVPWSVKQLVVTLNGNITGTRKKMGKEQFRKHSSRYYYRKMCRETMVNENVRENVSKKILIYIYYCYYHQKDPRKKKNFVTRKTYIENENLKGKSNPIARGRNIHCRYQLDIIRTFSPGVNRWWLCLCGICARIHFSW